MKSITKTWMDTTKKVSYIENLHLEGNHLWKSCKVEVKVLNRSKVGLMITVLENGSLVANLPEYTVVKSNKPFVYEVNINKKVPLIVCGFISPKSLFSKADILVSVTGNYDE